MSRIVGVAPVLPEYQHTQEEITAELARLIPSTSNRRAVMERLHAGTRIRTRHTALPLEDYRDLSSFGSANDHWLRIGTQLAERAARHALVAAGLEPADVDHVFFTSVTGIAAPSIDARLVPLLGLRPDVKRIPSFGLGCVAGASGLARVHDHLVGHSDDVALLVSVELCSLTVQQTDDSTANFVASGLFGDGAAAVVVVGSDRAERMGVRGPEIVGTRSTFYPDSADAIGWDVRDTGFQIVLSSRVGEIVERGFRPDVDALLAAHGVGLDDVGVHIAHPGGPRILDAFQTALELPEHALDASWASLERVGNLSSASVLHVLADVLDQRPGAHGLLYALGPGVAGEVLLLRWPD